MVRKIQKGIYYIKEPHRVQSEPLAKKQKPLRNKSFAILFLRVVEGFNASHVGQSLQKLWKMYEALEKGDTIDLPDYPVPTGELLCSNWFRTEYF